MVIVQVESVHSLAIVQDRTGTFIGDCTR